jgi:hypothetical protein
MLYIFLLLAKGHSDFEQIDTIAKLIVLVIEIILIGVMVWFLKSKQKFELYVTENEFHSEHPVFEEWCFTVNPKDIKQIKHHLNIGSGTSSINMIMNNGDVHYICDNYAYSRKKLYEALKKANPSIEFPENISVFKYKRSKEMDDYVTRQFPIMTRFFKWLLRIKPEK